MWLHEVLRRSQACGLVVLVTALTRGCSRPDAGPPEGRTAGTAMTAPDTTAHRSNRLIREKSPYLLQHANNPVEWYPWGEEALAKANAEKKPIFLSIGYSTCHWCHVMERESFEDPEIAELMNRWFVNIKVDREEHPDLDQIYMRAVTALTGHGGWPLTVFLTPDRQPFFGGTYFPPERRWNVPGLKDVLSSVAEAWRTKRQEIVTSAEGLTAALQQELAQGGTTGAVDVQTLHDAFNHATRSFDAAHGGFGDAPKFPRGHELSFLLHYWARTHTAQALEIATTTLDHMARGGLHDHLGGGFHRYATDARWLVPHFEKMLYDQALLGRTYLEAYRITRREAYAEVARGIFEYVLRDLTDAQGGFYSAEDADSEGEEGKFYVWTSADVTDVLGAEEAQLFCRFYGVTGEGNFEHGTSILNVEQALEDFATLKGYEPGALATRLSRARARLLEARAKRVRPHRDDKILTSWNGLMIASFAYGGAVLGEPRYLEAARRAAEFVLATLRRDGVLLRRYRDGESKYPGTLEDYAFFAHGLVELYEASFDPRYLAQAKLLASAMVDRFWDEASGGFFLRDWHEPMLIVRSKDVYDSATPSGNSVAALVLLRLGRLTAEAALEQYGRRTLDALAETVARAPFGYPQMLMAWDFGLGPTREIVIVGEPSSAGTAQLVGTIRQRFMPRAVVLQLPDGAGRGATEALAPYVKAQHAVGGAPTAYVCENFVCRLPVTSADELGRLLDAAGPAARGS